MPRGKTKSPNALIIGKKIYLRKPAARDAAEFLALNRASTKLHRALVSPPMTPAQFTSFLKRSRQDTSACFLICRVSDRQIVGVINLSQIFMGPFRSAYLGYYIGAPYAGQGYMTEAMQLMLLYSFTRLKLHRVEANVQPSNLSSIALIKRAGFVREGYSPRYLKIAGRWRDHERWTMLYEDWKKLRRD